MERELSSSNLSVADQAWQKCYTKLLNHKLSADVAATTGIIELVPKIF